MIILTVSILVVLTIILVVLIVFLYRLGHQPPIPTPENSPLEEMVKMMKEEKDNIDREKRDAELAAYAKKHIKQKPLGMIATTDQQDRPVKVKGTKELIPYGWSEEQKRLWEEFNS